MPYGSTVRYRLAQGTGPRGASPLRLYAPPAGVMAGCGLYGVACESPSSGPLADRAPLKRNVG
jgi:hypothetical protein